MMLRAVRLYRSMTSLGGSWAGRTRVSVDWDSTSRDALGVSTRTRAGGVCDVEVVRGRAKSPPVVEPLSAICARPASPALPIADTTAIRRSQLTDREYRRQPPSPVASLTL